MGTVSKVADVLTRMQSPVHERYTYTFLKQQLSQRVSGLFLCLF